MMLFAAICAALLALVLVVLIWPVLRGRAEAGDIRRARYALHRSVLAELEDDLRDGRLSADDHASAVAEAEVRLIDEVGVAAAAPESALAPGKNGLLLVSLVLFLSLAASGLYLLLGNPQALDPQARIAPQIGPAQIAGMVERLEAKLASEPTNLEGWLMLARSYRVLERYADARKAYEKAWPLVEKNAAELTAYAGVLAAENKSLSGRPTELVNQALKLDAKEPDALMLAGAAALQRGDKATARKRWEQLLPLLEPGSEDAKWLQQEIQQLSSASGVAVKP